MREIKFRAWDTARSGDGMHYGKENNCEIATNLFGQTYYHDFLNYQSGDSDELAHIDNGRFILMQFTGLKDKDGKDLDWWEGDLIRLSTDGPPACIVFYQGCFWFANYPEINQRLVPCHEYINHSPLEKIGNIHENSDLLNPVSAE